MSMHFIFSFSMSTMRALCIADRQKCDQRDVFAALMVEWAIHSEERRGYG